MPKHHPEHSMLIDYASGALPEALSLVTATHLALCPACRAKVGDIEAVGGAILEMTEPAAVSGEARARTLRALDGAGVAPPSVLLHRDQEKLGPVPLLPRPLRDYVSGELAEIAWRWRGSLSEAPIRLPGGFNVRLMKIRNGAAIPRHGHGGMEYTLVLAGGFSDEVGHYLRGDLSVADGALEHKPVADPGEDCICLAVSEGPARFTGLVGRIISQFQPR